MSKPYGMTAAFQIVVPDRVQNAIWDAVSESIDAGISPKDFMAEAHECWSIRLREKEKADMKAFDELRRERL